MDATWSWMMVLEKRGDWIRAELIGLLKAAEAPMSWREIDTWFLASGLREEQLAAVEQVMGNLISEGQVERCPWHARHLQVHRYQLPPLDRLAGL